MLDLNSILFSVTLVSLCMGLMLHVFIRSFQPLMRGARPIAWSSIVLGFGTAALALRGISPDLLPVSIVLGNLGTLLSQGLVHVGLCRLVDRHTRLPYVAGVLGTSYLGAIWYTFAMPSLFARVAILSAGLIVAVGLTIWELYCSMRLRKSLATMGLLVVLSILQTSLILRAVLTWLHRDGYDAYFADSPMQAITLMGVLLSLVLGILLCMMLIGERALVRLRESARREDLLTGLPNRMAADEAVEAALQNGAEQGRPTTVVRIDLDNFRQFNDWYGHDVGDAVLRHVTECIRRVLRRGRLLARWGGKGYIVVMPDSDGEAGAGLARDIVLEISLSPLALGHFDIEIAACAGVASSRRSESTSDAVMLAAEAALDSARRNPDGLAKVREID
ncbi:hypothetical protein GCM10025771_03160 [Niveibacterium umoris]|nr:GGDEF domain-containing protein [Niveibacterium umoris]